MRPARATAVAVAALALSGCTINSSRSDALDSLDALGTASNTSAPTTAPSAPTTDQPPEPPMSDSQRECEGRQLATRSLRPDPDGNVDDPFVAEIRERGFLEVGVDKNTLGFSVRDAASGEYEGFEVDLAHEIAREIFGSDYDPADVHFVPVASGEKRKLVADGTVDFTISANTMTCDRWEEVAFSSEYYTANQEFLVRADSDIRSVDDFAGARVCVTDGSSSQEILTEELPAAVPVLVDARIDCLVEIQEGRADAYFGHNSFQYGMMAQHPGLEMRAILPAEITESRYGIAIAHENEGFVRFVNRVLEDVVASGTWQDLHRQLEREDGPNIPPTDPPVAEYRD